MASPLPFHVAPREQTRVVSALVNDQECSLTFPVYGALRAGEIILIREHEYQHATGAQGARIAEALLGDGLDPAQAQLSAARILSAQIGVPVVLEPAEQEARIRHGALLASVQDELRQEWNLLALRTAAAMISQRLSGCADWGTEDAGRLPQPLIAAIVAFADSERNGGAEPQDPEAIVAGMADLLGKLSPGNSPETTPSTGDDSSGDADSSGPMPPSSSPTGSQTSASPTSSRRSKRASAG